MTYDKICGKCGKPFTALAPNRKYCSTECSRKANADCRRVRLGITKKKKVSSLRQVAVEARKAGMTYGQYVAQMEMKGERL